MLTRAYNLVMNENRNPLSYLPRMVRFQYMTILSFMWSAVFTLWVGTMAVFGPTMAAHMLVLVAIFFTADIFRRARHRTLSHDNTFRDPRDGCARYDDVWGAR